MRKYASLYERLIANSIKPDDQNECGCWVWTGKRDRRGEYGHLNVYRDGKHKTVKAHREMEQVFLDRPLDPETETIDHWCGNGLCINPDHWELITRVENSSRSWQANPRGFQDGR